MKCLPTHRYSRGPGGVGAQRAPCPGRSPELPALLPGAGWRQGAGEPRPGQERSAAQSKGSGAASSPANGSVKWQQLEDRASLGSAPGPSLLRRRRRARRTYLAGSRPTPGPLGPAGGSRGALHSRRERVPGWGGRAVWSAGAGWEGARSWAVGLSWRPPPARPPPDTLQGAAASQQE